MAQRGPVPAVLLLLGLRAGWSAEQAVLLLTPSRWCCRWQQGILPSISRSHISVSCGSESLNRAWVWFGLV